MDARGLIILVFLLGCTSFQDAAPVENLGPYPQKDKVTASDRVWFVPNETSSDLLDLFGAVPDRWPRARMLTNVMMFYRPMLDGSCRGNDSLHCGPNTLDNLAGRDAFRWLEDQGVKIAVASSVIVGAEGARDCDGASNLAGALTAVKNVRRNNATLDYIDMDEPWNKAIHEGTTACYQETEIASAAAVVHNFMQSIRVSYPKDNIRIGLTEPYPAGSSGGLSVQQIKTWLTALEAADAVPAFLHLDIDMNKLRHSHKDRLKDDLVALNAFCRSKGIVFGVIYWGGETTSDCDYYKSAMAILKYTKQAIGIPEHSLFMSFTQSANTPANLPEWSNCTHTKLIRDGWRELTGEHQ